MSHADRVIPAISLVVRWPKCIPATSATQFLRRLEQGRISSTWAVEDPEQIRHLSPKTLSKARVSTALLASGNSNGAVLDSIERGLVQFEAAGEQLAAIQTDGGVARGSIERRLCKAGVRAIIAGATGGKSTIIRPLPFGVWEFRPHATAPAARRWLGLFGSASGRMRLSADLSPSVISIDLGRCVDISARSWNAIGRLIQDIEATSAGGAIRIATIAEIASELSYKAVARPQRSILRAAA